MKNNNNNTKVFVALSGGVDSAVTAALLKQDGYDVTGIFMKNWSGDDFGIQTDCPWEQDQKDAEAVATKLGIPFRSFNFEKQYRQAVVGYFFDEIKKGRTPNPDVMCNKEIKFKIFLERAIAEGADLIATGHYARNIKTANGFQLHTGVDTNKDQSYFLYTLNQVQLSKTLFPVGVFTKPQIRDFAAKFKLPAAKKKDSQGICFIGEINVPKFLRANIPLNPGNIIDIDSKLVVGKHDGIAFYTIGQREGLKIGGSGLPYYVVGKNHVKNELIVARGNNNPALFNQIIKFAELHLINPQDQIPNTLEASIRYRQRPASGKLNINTMTFSFNDPQRAIAEGQSIVFYTGSHCLGGAVITS